MILTVALLPVYRNPYQHLLTAALTRHDVQVLHLKTMPSAAWLRREQGRVQVLHLHWLYGLYMNRYRTPLTWPRFLAHFALARRLGYRIVWTAHNILPHRMPFPPIHLIARRLVMAQADAVIAHCEYGREELLRRFPRRGPVYVIPHGNYDGVHPVSVTRTAARAVLHIEPNRFVYLMLGNIAPYKGIERFVETFQAQAGPEEMALIAGRNRFPPLVQRLERMASADPRLQVFPRFITDDDMQHFLRAADVAIFCFENILTSGSVILAMTYGLPVIAPAMGCLPELVTPEAGILYDPADPHALGEALRRIKGMDTARMGEAAHKIAAALRWDDIARRTAGVYRECLA